MHYNQVVFPCIEAEEGGEICSQQPNEIEASLAYKSWVQSQWDFMPASAAFVAFHNLVTSSIDARFLQGNQHNFYCVREVLGQVPPRFIDDIGALQADAGAAPATGVPGLDPASKIIACV